METSEQTKVARSSSARVDAIDTNPFGKDPARQTEIERELAAMGLKLYKDLKDWPLGFGAVVIEGDTGAPLNLAAYPRVMKLANEWNDLDDVDETVKVSRRAARGRQGQLEPENAIRRAERSRGGQTTAAGVADEMVSEENEIRRAGVKVPEAAADAAPKTLLNGRFVRNDAGEYARVNETRVALADEGDRIRFVDKQMDAFQAGVELAQAKGWDAIEISGTEQFKAEAWLHARLAGLEVIGFEPNYAEQRLAAARAREEEVRANPLSTDEQKDAVKEDRKTLEFLNSLDADVKAQGRGLTPSGVAEAGTPAQAPADAALKDASAVAALVVEKKAQVQPPGFIESRQEAGSYAVNFADRNVGLTDTDKGRYSGPILFESAHHVVQDVGRNKAVLHEKSALQGVDISAHVGQKGGVRIQYSGGRAAVEVPQRLGQSLGR